MNKIVDLIKKQFRDYIFDIEEDYEDELKFKFDNCELDINGEIKFSIYRRYYFSKFEEYNGQNTETDKAIVEFSSILCGVFGEKCQMDDDSCFGCDDSELIIGYFNRDINYEFIKKFIQVSNNN